MNEFWTVVGVAVCGGIGAAVRHLIDSSLPAPLRARFPWGIMMINLSGSLILGFLTGLSLGLPVMQLVTLGFLGGYTTFSTASLDAVKMLIAKRYLSSLLNGPGMLLLAVALAVCGVLAGIAVGGEA